MSLTYRLYNNLCVETQHYKSYDLLDIITFINMLSKDNCSTRLL